ncbi:MAG: hypothetical protein U0838_13750 [Chloroflexota bacterium]
MPEASVVCFRHSAGGRDAAATMDPRTLDDHQDRLCAALRWTATAGSRRRRCAGAHTSAGIVNYLTTEADIDRLLATLRRLAAGL